MRNFHFHFNNNNKIFPLYYSCVVICIQEHAYLMNSIKQNSEESAIARRDLAARKSQSLGCPGKQTFAMGNTNTTVICAIETTPHAIPKMPNVIGPSVNARSAIDRFLTTVVVLSPHSDITVYTVVKNVVCGVL